MSNDQKIPRQMSQTDPALFPATADPERDSLLAWGRQMSHVVSFQLLLLLLLLR